MNRNHWFFEFPAQCIIVVDQIMWTRGCVFAIEAAANGTDKHALAEFLRFSQRQLDSMVALVRSDLTRLQRKLMGALIVIDVHARDVVTEMVKKSTFLAAPVDFQRVSFQLWACLMRRRERAG